MLKTFVWFCFTLQVKNLGITKPTNEFVKSIVDIFSEKKVTTRKQILFRSKKQNNKNV
jgi:hypothetical protein